jgi:hypothetical protein
MHDRKIEIGAAYLHGRIEAQLEIYATSMGVPSFELTNRVAALLLTGSQGSTENSMPDMRGEATETRQALRKMEMAGRPSKGRPRKTGPRGYWAKMTPLERKSEMRRRYAVRLAKRKKEAA